MTHDRSPVAATPSERLRHAVELVGAAAVAITHVAGAVGAIAAARRRSARCR